MKTLLVPKNTRFFPNHGQRLLSANRNTKYTLEMFDTYNDWFYFIHIDPAQRYLHAFGMFVGTYFFILMAFYWGAISIIYYLLGVFFFYVLGILSHLLYDMGTARSSPKYFMQTFIPVVRINLLTTIGRYDQSLREFVKKYPFTIEAYDLEEVSKRNLIRLLIGPDIKKD